jgi:hypothetical protein
MSRKRKRPAARATEPRATFQDTYDSSTQCSGQRFACQSWQSTDAEAGEVLRRAVAFIALSLCHQPRCLPDLLDARPLIIVKVRAGVRGALACERIGEFLELGATVVLVALDFDAAGLLDRAGQRSETELRPLRDLVATAWAFAGKLAPSAMQTERAGNRLGAHKTGFAVTSGRGRLAACLLPCWRLLTTRPDRGASESRFVARETRSPNPTRGAT